MLCTRQSPDEISVPGRLQLMIAVKMRACRRLSGADPEEPDKNLLKPILNWARGCQWQNASVETLSSNTWVFFLQYLSLG